jgi:hypothetical protein
MAQADSLKRLGGGRWETKDGRFQIEPQSGTWVIVDTTQTNEFGLPLVRGPFPSLGAAKEAIESARGEGPVTSPLAERIEMAGKEPAETAGASATKAKKGSRAASTGPGDAIDEEPPEPPAPPEPAWLRDLKPVGRQKATALIERLEKLGIADAEAIARAEIAEGEPALTRLALERSINAAIKSKRDPRSAAAAAVEAIMAGEDAELEVEWSLVDDRGRRIEELDLDR